MDSNMINCVILSIHVDKKIIPSHAIYRQTSVSTRYGSKKIRCLLKAVVVAQVVERRHSVRAGWVQILEHTFSNEEYCKLFLFFPLSNHLFKFYQLQSNTVSRIK